MFLPLFLEEPAVSSFGLSASSGQPGRDSEGSELHSFSNTTATKPT
jgi:hypothetical protein